MTTATVTNSKGTILAKGDGASPEVFTAIVGIQDMPAMSTAKSVKDRTDLSDDIRDYGLGIGEPPQITLTCFWDKTNASQAGLITEHTNETEYNYQVQIQTSPVTTKTFRALVPSYTTPYGGVDGDLMWDITFQLVENENSEIITTS
jgi:hypothetical protein